MEVRLGSTKYTVTQDAPIGMDDFGYIDSGDGIIAINPYYPEQARKQTFWHEAIHGFLGEMGMKKLCENEQFVDSFSRMLYAFHEDNDLEDIYNNLTNGGEKE